jgi:hypothetical protein
MMPRTLSLADTEEIKALVRSGLRPGSSAIRENSRRKVASVDSFPVCACARDAWRTKQHGYY